MPLTFDPAGLRADLATVEARPWTAHFVPDNYVGRWDVLPLRHAAGAAHPILQIASPPDATDFVDAPVLATLPHITEALGAFRCPLHAVRLMRLTPGSRIKEHRDHDLSAEFGFARIHIPIETNPGVEFLLNRTPVVMAPGETWYLRLADPHAVGNDGSTDRIHLVIDCVVNDWLAALLDAQGRIS